MENFWRKAIDMPPSWLLIFMAAIWLQTRIWNPVSIGSTLIVWLGWGSIVLALVLAVWCFRLFKRHKTTIIPRNEPSSMIVEGPYRFSRNPIYLADAILLAGFALVLGSLIGLVLVAGFIKLINVRFIIGEEAGLRSTFPAEFADYCAQTRRWI